MTLTETVLPAAVTCSLKLKKKDNFCMNNGRGCLKSQKPVKQSNPMLEVAIIRII